MFEQLYEWASSSPLVALVYFLVILPVSLCLAPKGSLDSATNVQFDFKAFRLQQFDLQTVPLGHSTTELFDRSLGAVLVLLPKDLSELTEAEIQQLAVVESDLYWHVFDYPVYVAPVTHGLTGMLRSLQGTNDALKGSALSALVDGVTANAYSLVSQTPSPMPKVDEPLYNIIGKLSSFERSDKTSTIVIVAYYDSFGASPALSYGADSNGSGVAALLELLRMFSKLYASAKTRPNKDLVFLLSAAGKLNYQGSRHWIDQLYEQTDNNPSVEAVVCLDALAGGRGLRMHVSKAPSDGSILSKLHQRFDSASRRLFNDSNDAGVPLVPKKINLADQTLAWEHERYSIRRLPAFTLSHYDKNEHAAATRNSIGDTIDRVSKKALFEHTSIIADGLIRHVYDLPDTMASSLFESQELSDVSSTVNAEVLSGWLSLLARHARSAQLLADTGLKHPVVADLVAAVEAHSTNMQTVPITTDKKEPEFALYPVYEVNMAAHRVKPAVFDLLLAVIIGGYLAVVYAAVLNAETVITMMQSRVKASLVSNKLVN